MTMNPATELIEALIHDTPALPGALCRIHRELFDATIGNAGQADGGQRIKEARREARAICAECPALQACRDWVDGLRPFRRPRGIVGGSLIDQHGMRPSERYRRNTKHQSREQETPWVTV